MKNSKVARKMKAGVDAMDAAVQDAVSQQKYPLLNLHISSHLQK